MIYFVDIYTVNDKFSNKLKNIACNRSQYADLILRFIYRGKDRAPWGLQPAINFKKLRKKVSVRRKISP